MSDITSWTTELKAPRLRAANFTATLPYLGFAAAFALTAAVIVGLI